MLIRNVVVVVKGFNVVVFVSNVFKIVRYLLMGKCIEVVFIVVVVKMSNGIVSGNISMLSSILLCLSFIVSVTFGVLRKLSVGVFSSSVSVIIC